MALLFGLNEFKFCVCGNMILLASERRIQKNVLKVMDSEAGYRGHI